jgi:O-glycosyl hydrolase
VVAGRADPVARPLYETRRGYDGDELLRSQPDPQTYRQTSSLTRRLAVHAAIATALATILLVWVAARSANSSTQYRGVQLHSLWSTSSSRDMDRELDLAKRFGSTVVRVDVGWSSLEQDGKREMAPLYLAKLNRFMAGAKARGVKVIATLWSTPCWASSAPKEQKQGCEGSWWDRGVAEYPPTRAGDYADIVRWMTARYGTVLAAVEVWNEPTLSGGRFLHGSNRAAAYAALLKAAYPAAKAGNRSVHVLATLDGTDRAFLQAIYGHGIRGSYDGLGAHPYGERDFSGLKALRAFQSRNGDVKPIWVTEFGWPTRSDRGGNVSEAEQAVLIRSGFARLRSIPWVRAAVLYELRDAGTDPNNMEHNWGILRRDYSPKPAFEASRDSLAARP